MKKFTAISALLTVASMAKADCWSSAMGYSCCTGCDVKFEDENGKWGVEQDGWCGIVDEICNKPSQECWSAPDYPCCKGNTVVYSDDAGDWGLEDGQWCGIVKATEEEKPAEEKPTEEKPAEEKPAEENPVEENPVEEKENKSCWSYPTRPCCKGNEIRIKDKRGAWGYEDGKWCGIDVKAEEQVKSVEEEKPTKNKEEEQPQFTEQQVQAAPKFSMESGFYEEVEGMTLSLNSTEGTVYYTLDSSDPTTSSTAVEYNGEIKMYDRSIDPNLYSEYQQEDDSPYSVTLKNPYRASKNLNEKITVVRAATKLADGTFSPVVTKSFLVMDKDNVDLYSKISVVSLVTDPSNLFDKDKGIYVCGQQYLDWKNSSDYIPNKNEWDYDNIANFFSRGKEWERPATFTLFENGKEVKSQDVGIRIKGFSTRNHHVKSFNINMKKKYGSNRFEYDIIKGNKNIFTKKEITKYDEFSLRTFNWFDRMRESIIQKALKDTPILATFDSTKAVLFIDGEFWGSYDICEKSSPLYYENNYSLPRKDVAIVKNDILEEGTEADLKDFSDLVEFSRKFDLTEEENYKYIEDRMDIESLIYHYAVGFYLGIYDWPNRNYLVYRNNGSPIEGNEYSDGRWRFGSFDFDYSAGLTYADFGGVEGYEHDSFKKFQIKADEYPTPIFSNIVKNKKFYKRFTEVMYEMSETVFNVEKMKEIVEDQKKNYMDYIVKTDWRWYFGTPTMDFKTFQKGQNVYFSEGWDDITKFFEKRPQYVYKFMEKQYGKPE